MKTLQAQVPDLLLQELNELAKSQGATVDHLVSLALAAQVSAWRTRQSLRAERKKQSFMEHLLAMPDVGPDEIFERPKDYGRDVEL